MKTEQTNHTGSESIDLALPKELLDAVGESNDGHGKILANLALANRIMNANLAQQNAVAIQQAMYQLNMAAVAKSIKLISAIDPTAPNAVEQIREFRELIESFMEQFREVAAMVRVPVDTSEQ